MKPLEGIWWEMEPGGARHRARLRGCDLPDAWDIALSWGAEMTDARVKEEA